MFAVLYLSHFDIILHYNFTIYIIHLLFLSECVSECVSEYLYLIKLPNRSAIVELR